MTKKKEENENGYESGGVAFVGLTIIGVGIGFLVGNIIPYTLFGVGAGFVALGVFRAVLGKK